MSECALTIFDTAIGRCALMWRGGLIVGAALPEASEAGLRASLKRRFPGSGEADPPPFVQAAVEAVVRLLSGKAEDFSGLALDMEDLPAFDRSVLEETRRIPCGETRTYGEIAFALASPGAARAVGRALGRNPLPIIIPCHRVLAASGRSGGFSAPGGASTKLRILEIEGARRGPEPELFERLPWAVKPGS
ncbi:MAG: methylated-DNA--[protein]-cysteine S-methyltransferase [Pseudomonadota bacterium]|nr:methylated-DNA--[protein]-cysteine S-methyltransferase [Pseudomonadota bacterium]